MQRPAKRPATRAAEAANAPAPLADYVDANSDIDPDELQPLLLDDDDAELPRADAAANTPGFTEFGTFSDDFGDCPRMARMEQGQDAHWTPGMRNFHVPISTASNYDYFMHFFDHEFFVNEMFEHTKAASPSALITLDELWTFLALRMIMSCYTHHQVSAFFALHERDHLRAAPYLGDHMTLRRFKEINAALRTSPDRDAGLPDKFFVCARCAKCGKSIKIATALFPVS